jgi:hypothetical protein
MKAYVSIAATLVVLVALAAQTGVAAASTLRIACDDGAAGAEVTVNGKFKGECPIDVQVPAGTANVKVTKTVNGKPTVFEQAVRIGDGVVKRLEVSFDASASPADSVGAASARPAPAMPDAGALDKQRYELEMTQYRNSIGSCLPRHAVELRRLIQQVQNAWRRVYSACRSEALGREYDASQVRTYCGDSTLDDIDDPPTRLDPTPEYREYRRFDSDAQSWCEEQFTRPRPPAGFTGASMPDARASDTRRSERLANSAPPPPASRPPAQPALTPAEVKGQPERPASDPEVVARLREGEQAAIRKAEAERAQKDTERLVALYDRAKAGDVSKFAEIKELARQGNPEAQNFAAACYLGGYGTEKDNVEATRWLIRSARQGNPHASKNLEMLRKAGYMVDVLEQSTK